MFPSTPPQSTYKYDFTYNTGCWGSGRYYYSPFSTPSGRAGPKETNAMGPNLHRPKLASEEETKILFMSRAWAKLFNFPCSYQEIYSLEIKCLSVESLKNLFHVGSSVLQTWTKCGVTRPGTFHRGRPPYINNWGIALYFPVFSL